MKNIKKGFDIIRYFLMVVIGLLAIFVLLGYLKMKIFKQAYPSVFGYSYFKVISNSMAPKINKNDVILVKTNQEKYQVKDIITYQKDKYFVTHRIVKIVGDKYLTKGDANNIGDEPISKKIIVGKVVKVFPNLGIWKDILLTPKILIVLFITLLLFDDSFKEWTKSKYYYFKDFKISKEGIIEERADSFEKTKKRK